MQQRGPDRSIPLVLIGLGNPGPEYQGTRHNVGFEVADRVVERLRRPVEGTATGASLTSGSWKWRKVHVLKPTRFMNLSGEPVRLFLEHHQLTVPQCLVVVDDLDLPLGAVRMRTGGGTGGHRGLDSIQGLLGKDDFPRLRLGIGRPEPNRDVSGFVLGKFADSETGLLEKVLETAADQLACWVLQGIGQAMNEYNGDYAPTEKKTDDEIRRDDHPEGNRT